MKKLKDYITDVPGVLAGHAQNVEAGTGCTAILFPDSAAAGVDVRGGAPGTRETDVLAPVNSVERIHAFNLGGGCAFGLAGADGVMQFLEERGIGFNTGIGIVPIVPGAGIFDLPVGDGRVRPDREMGYAAAKNATEEECGGGVIGVGTGARTGIHFGSDCAMKSGIGGASMESDGIIVGVLVAVNPRGDVVDPDTGKILSGAYDRKKRAFINTTEYMCKNPKSLPLTLTGNTTIGVVATNARLSKAQAKRVAMMTHDAFARTITPIHTFYDGDTVFCASTGDETADITSVGVMATELMARAIVKAVMSSKGAYGLPGYQDVHKP